MKIYFIGIHFRETDQIYSFKTFEKDLAPGTFILCETCYGLRIGKVVQYFDSDDKRTEKATQFVLGSVQEVLDSFQKKHDAYMGEE